MANKIKAYSRSFRCFYGGVFTISVNTLGHAVWYSNEGGRRRKHSYNSYRAAKQSLNRYCGAEALSEI